MQLYRRREYLGTAMSKGSEARDTERTVAMYVLPSYTGAESLSKVGTTLKFGMVDLDALEGMALAFPVINRKEQR